MIKNTFNPWKWQETRSYAQAIEVKNVESTLYCSGQAAINAEGISSDADMKDQLSLAIENLEKVITTAGFNCDGIVRLNIYTTSAIEFLKHFPILQEWLKIHRIEQAMTVLEVKGLYENLMVELEATAVK